MPAGNSTRRMSAAEINAIGMLKLNASVVAAADNAWLDCCLFSNFKHRVVLCGIIDGDAFRPDKIGRFGLSDMVELGS